MKNSYLGILLVLIGAILLMTTAFQNGYPLIFVGDTGGYMKYGFLKDHGHDGRSHSFLYGLFIFLFSFHSSLFFVAFIQCILLSYLIFITFNYFNKDIKSGPYYFIGLIAVFSFFSGVTKYSGKIMPDVFTGMMILSAGNVLFNHNITKWQKISLYLIFIFSIAFHTSHFLIIVVTLILYALISYLMNKELFRQNMKSLLLLGGLIIIQLLIVSTIHFMFYGEFYYVKGKHVFLMGRLSDSGILNQFLKDEQYECDYRICKYSNTYYNGNTFIWDLNKSPTYMEYGNANFNDAWAACEEDYNRLIMDLFSDIKYLYKFALNSLINTGILLFNCYESEEVNFHDGWTDDKIYHHLPDDIINYRNSLQSKGKFAEIENRIKTYQSIFIPLSVIFIIYFNDRNKFKNDGLKQFMMLIGILFLVNAIICGTFSGAYIRYQEKVAWLIPLFALLALGSQIKPKEKNVG